MDIERVRVGQTADNNLHECGMSLLDVITLVPRLSSKLPAQVGRRIMLKSLNLPMHGILAWPFSEER